MSHHGVTRVDYVALLNHCANHPDVLPHVAPHHDEIDLSRFFDVPENCMFGDARGLLLFAYHTPSHTYQMHWLLTSAIRGAAALAMARNAIGTMFTNFDCCAITGMTPRENSAARLMNRALGASPVGDATDSQGRACIVYRLERSAWAKRGGVLSETSSEASSGVSAH